jgi:ketosteroid isomerase-like protein
MTVANDDLKTIIRDLEARRYDAMLAKDVEALEKLFDDDLVYTHSSGTVDSKRSYIDGVKARLWDYKAIDRFDENIVAREGAVLVFNRTKMDIDIRGKNTRLDNNTVAVWTRSDDGEWRFVALGSTARNAHA